MRFDALTRGAFAVLLMAALCLPTASAQSADAAEVRALATRAYTRIQPIMREAMRKAYVEGLTSGEVNALAGCEAVSRQVRADLERDTTPLVMELFFSEQMQQRVEGILADVYDAQQLRAIADGGDPPSRAEQSAKIDAAFQALNAEFQQSIGQDSRVVAAIVKVMQNAAALKEQCRAEQDAG